MKQWDFEKWYHWKSFVHSFAVPSVLLLCGLSTAIVGSRVESIELQILVVVIGVGLTSIGLSFAGDHSGQEP